MQTDYLTLTLLVSAWIGLPLQALLNDNGLAVNSYDGEDGNIGLVLYALFGGPFIAFCSFFARWYYNINGNGHKVALLALDQTTRKSKPIDAESLERLKRRSAFGEENLWFITLAFFGFFFQIIIWFMLLNSSTFGFDTVVVGS